MAGIYIHVPFCKSRCIYCDFYSDTDETQIDAFVQALRKEIHLRKHEIADEPIRTIYFGGGTPSRLHPRHFDMLFDTLFSEFAIDNDAEITLEGNPDDLSESYLKMLARQAFNRLSIGIQSFDDAALKFLSRRHSARQAVEVVQFAQGNGFENMSIDLMYGLPKQTIESWRADLQQAVALDVPHISAYHLTYEEKTPLDFLRRKGRVKTITEQTSLQMFEMLIDTLAENGFEHYEISNFAKNKQYARHNTAYWKGEKYLGLGAAAHSFDGVRRAWNVASLTEYIAGIEADKPQRIIENLSLSEKYNEFIMTGLRTMWGVQLDVLEKRFGTRYAHYCRKTAEKYIAENLLRVTQNALTLTRQGIFVSDGIMSDLMWID